jgi:hypothetical protein
MLSASGDLKSTCAVVHKVSSSCTVQQFNSINTKTLSSICGLANVRFRCFQYSLNNNETQFKSELIMIKIALTTQRIDARADVASSAARMRLPPCWNLN